MSTLEQLAAAREDAWRRYDQAQRALPQCEHVQAWLQDIEQARGEHQAAVRAWSRAARQEVAPAAPVAALEDVPAASEAEPELDCQEALFDLEGAA